MLPPFRQRLRETLNDYGRARKWFFGLSILIGLGIFAAGIVIDVLGCWGSLSFAPNAMTSLAGFFVGVPVALVLLSALQAEREDQSQLDKLEKLSDSAWHEFSRRVSEFCSENRTSTLQFAAEQIAPVWAGIQIEFFKYSAEFHEYRAEFHEYRARGSPITDLSTGDEYTSFQARLQAWSNELRTLVEHANSALPNGQVLQTEWIGVQRSWTLLDTYVKLQRFELDLGWLPPRIDTDLQHKLSQNGNPIHEFSDVHDQKTRYFDRPTMGDIPDYLSMCSRMSEEELAQSLARARARKKNTSPPHEVDFANYASAASHAQDFLESLKRDIKEAEEREGWPYAP